MRHSLGVPFAAMALICAAAAAPAFAQSQNAYDHANSNASFLRAAPGPLAGVGLPFLAVAGAAGAYRMFRRRREERRDPGEAAGRG
jgi:hypothetical protein